MKRSAAAGERLVALATLALGVCFAVGTVLLPAAPGYSQVGPGVIPAIVAVGLILFGIALVAQAFGGGFRRLPQADRDEFDLRRVAYVCLGLLAHAALIGAVGFIASSTLLFVVIARAFGSVRWIRDASVALVIAALLYWLFTQMLKLSLGPVLGSLGGVV